MKRVVTAIFDVEGPDEDTIDQYVYGQGWVYVNDINPAEPTIIRDSIYIEGVEPLLLEEGESE